MSKESSEDSGNGIRSSPYPWVYDWALGGEAMGAEIQTWWEGIGLTEGRRRCCGASLVEFAEVCSLGCWGRMFAERCLTRGCVLQTIRGRLRRSLVRGKWGCPGQDVAGGVRRPLRMRRGGQREAVRGALLVGLTWFGKEVILVGVSRWWPVRWTWPSAWFCVAYKLRMVFTFSNEWEKK